MSKVVEWRHVWLYSRSRYQRGDVLEDLRVIVARGFGRDPQHISNQDVLDVVYNVASPYLNRSDETSGSILLILKNLLYVSQQGNRPLTVEDIILELLHILRFVWVWDREGGGERVTLGEPDYTLLPKPE